MIRRGGVFIVLLGVGYLFTKIPAIWGLVAYPILMLNMVLIFSITRLLRKEKPSAKR